ncbi:MAG: aldehyde dehydrogenase family protein [candidate division Zixibacteria bacterium]|nr:aldehyde dehydrogenase family protein [candidate division Zixibacteria bacterium]
MSLKFALYLAGKWAEKALQITVKSPYDKSVVGVVSSASSDDYTLAIEAAHTAFAQTRELPSYVREKCCLSIAEQIKNSHEEFAKVLSLESGKSLKEAKLEVNRAIGVFRISAEESKRIGGEIINLDWNPGSENRIGLVRRFPLGVIAGITPFNFPLNLVAHKIGPAMASGNTIVLKPASATPLSAMLLAEAIDKTDYPKGAISILPGQPSETSPLIKDERVKLISFTGSGQVGWWIKEQAPRKKVVLELGGNAGVIVADDADLEWATTRLVTGAFGVAGQSCISVQRIFIHANVYEQTIALFTKKTKALKIGNPIDSMTDLGCMITPDAVEKASMFISNAVSKGAKVLTGGTVTGQMIEPTILTDVDRKLDVNRTEAFAPIVIVEKYEKFTDAVAAINDSPFGLQAGVFTNRMNDIMYSFKYIDCGGVIVNDIPTYRADQMPYGGMKDSGTGREGIRYAIESMTEIKLLALKMDVK